MTLDRIPRRKLLAGLAGGTTIATAGLALTTERSRAFTDTMAIQTDEIDGLLLDWRRTYNGSTIPSETAGDVRLTASGPGISLGNVLPGDVGSFSAHLRLEPEANGEIAVEPAVTFAVVGELESPGLQEFVHAEVWYDTGFPEIDAFGARNAERDFGEGLIHPDAAGTLEEVATALEGGVSLQRCLDDDTDSVTITFSWSFPVGQPNVNAVQGDAVEFDLLFDANHC